MSKSTIHIDFEKKQIYFNEEVNKINQFYTKQIEEVMKFSKPVITINTYGECRFSYDDVTQKQIDLIMQDREQVVQNLYNKIFSKDD